jgi:hypothetical protein
LERLAHTLLSTARCVPVNHGASEEAGKKVASCLAVLLVDFVDPEGQCQGVTLTYNWEAYTALRVKSYGFRIPLFLVFQSRVDQTDLADAVDWFQNNPEALDLVNRAALVAGLANDVFSYESELKNCTEPVNAVHVIRTLQNCSSKDASEWVIGLMKKQVQELNSAMKAAVGLNDAAPMCEGHKTWAGVLCDSIRETLAGHHQWSCTCGKHRYGAGPEVAPLSK